VDEHLLRLMNISFRRKEELKIEEENNGRKNTSKLVRFEKL
jgi:hypothetical protein